MVLMPEFFLATLMLFVFGTLGRNAALFPALPFLGFLILVIIHPVVAAVLGALTLMVLAQYRLLDKDRMTLLGLIWIVLILVASQQQAGQFLGVSALFLLPFNAHRHLHLLACAPRLQPQALGLVLNYLWHPGMLLATAERYEDFAKTYAQKCQWREGLKTGCLALIVCYSSRFMTAYFVDPIRNSDNWAAMDSSMLLCGALLIGPAFFFDMVSMFLWARAVMHGYGVTFTEPLYGRVWWPKGPIDFWLNWNIPMIRVLREAVFLPALRVMGQVSWQSFAAILMVWWFLQALWHKSWYFGLFHAFFVLAELLWISQRTRYSWMHSLRGRGRALMGVGTLLLILYSAAIWPGDMPTLWPYLFHRIVPTF